MTTPLFKPMLSGSVDSLDQLKFPLLASPKLDGIRVTVQNGVLLSRNLKPIRNKHCQKLFGRAELNGLDGELIVGEPWAKDCMQATSSGVMSAEGEPEVKLYVFDVFCPQPYFERILEAVMDTRRHPAIKVLPQKDLKNQKELLDYENWALDKGYEGVMLRSVDGPYKQGRSTVNEGYLLKLKVFEFDTGVIVDVEQGHLNNNVQTTDALGHAKRSTHKENMVPNGELGTFLVHITTGPFKGKKARVGRGRLTKEEAAHWWTNRKALIGREIEFKHFLRGSKDLPRFPLYNKGL